MKDRMTAARDWAALAGALAMVGFLTFVPQHGPVAETFRSETARHAQMSWPSQVTDTAGASAVR